MCSRLLTNQWPYKLAALIIAIALHFYVSHANDPHIAKSLNIPVVLKSVPSTLQVSDATPDVTLQLSGPTSSLDAVTPASYVATVDLGSARAGTNDQIPIVIDGTPGIPQDVVIESATPRAATVVMESRVRKQIAVSATFPSISAPGLSFGAPKVVPPVASINGPESSVDRVARLVVHGDDAVNGERVAPGVLEGFGEIEPLDAQNLPVPGVVVVPEQAELRIPVTRETAVKELIVNPTITGSPVYPALVTDVQVQPARLAVTGATDVLAGTSVLATAPLDISGLKSDETRQLAVTMPTGLRAEDAAPTVTVTVTVRISTAPANAVTPAAPTATTMPVQ